MNSFASTDHAGSREPAALRAEVLVATTWQCNLRCSYCFVEQCGLNAGGARMPAGLARRVVDTLDEGLPDVESICVHLYGGEPLTNLPAMEAMLERSRDKRPGRFSWAITTNGTICSDAAIDLLARGQFQVILSIDGPAEIHNECRRTARGAPTHALVMEFLRALRSRTNCWVRGSAVVRSGWNLAQAVKYLQTLPVDAIKAQAVRAPAGVPYALSETEKAEYLDDLQAIGQQVIAALEAGQTPKDDRFSGRVLQLLAGIRRERFCAAGDTTFGITPVGEILPCVLIMTEGCVLGRVGNDPAIWRKAGRAWRTSRPLRPECKTCSALPLCGGGCPAIVPVCGADECDLVRKNCSVATSIYKHFRSKPEELLTLAGIS
jgi:uncharacterized protein